MIKIIYICIISVQFQFIVFFAYETINLHKYMIEKWQGNLKEAKSLLIWVTLNRFNIK